MNSFIETLNQWGGKFSGFAWPMFWQSSLLIAVLFAFDFLFRRKLRASIRYALWLVVLVKLLVPPTLALPTSPAWWLGKAPPPAAIKPAARFTVTYGHAPLPEIPQTAPPVFVPPKPAMTFAAWLLVVSISISSALLLWLLARWWQVARMVREATAAEQFSEQLCAALRLAGTPVSRPARFKSEGRHAGQETGAPPAREFSVRVKIVEGPMSPAVCGLFRPAILIPQSLAENFSDGQLRAVLLHELIHLRRRDVWVNFMQALLQIFYWWHPLVWLANARIRRVREEAVDDAVMLALRDEAESYAPTLLEVAKLALNRPLASLGLVGILESRHALRQRIERLVDFRPPRRAGLTLVSLLGILAFTAVAVPMGDGPSPAEERPVSLPTTTPPKTVTKKTIPKTILVTSHFYWMRNAEVEKIISDLKFNSSANDSSWPVSPEKLSQITDALRSSSFSEFAAPRVVTINHETAAISVSKGTNGIFVTCTPNVTNSLVNLVIHCTVNEDSFRDQISAESTLEDRGGIVIRANSADQVAESNLLVLVSVQIDPTNFIKNFIKTSEGRQAIMQKLKTIRLDRVAFDAVPLHEVIRSLTEESYTQDPDRQGINFLLNPNQPGATPKIDPGTGLPVTTNDVPAAGLPSLPITISPALTNITLGDALDALVKAAPEPIQYSVVDYGIIFSPAAEPFYERLFKVHTNTFSNGLKKATGLQTNGIAAMAKSYFSALGVHVDSPGKLVEYDAQDGFLIVRATTSDLDTIEQVVDVLNNITALDNPGPQVHIKARFVEVTQDKSGASRFDWYLGQFKAGNSVSGNGGSSLSPSVPVSVANPLGVVPGKTASSVGNVSNSATDVAQLMGILTDSNFRVVLHALENRPGAEPLGEPEGTTTSGRQMQMRATKIINVITNFSYHENDVTNNSHAPSVIPQSAQVETGPVLDTVAYVLSDGFTINLTAIPSFTEFLGYDKPTNNSAVLNAAGQKVDLPVVLPRFDVRQNIVNVNLYDGQTLVFGKLPDEVTVGGKKADAGQNVQKSELLIFVTVTLVDSAGNRIHNDEELPFAKDRVPPQPAKK